MFRSLAVFSVLVLCVVAQDPEKFQRYFSFPLKDDIEPRVDAELYRLPNDTYPEKYEIFLTTRVHEADFDFEGSVVINLRTKGDVPTNEIVIHQRQLTINEVSLTTATTPPVPITLQDPAFEYYDTPEFLVIRAQSDLALNTAYILTIDYNGTLRGDMGGFYRSSYQTPEGETRWLATTQFESTNARHGFPCYDEPALKAEFVIHITHDPSYNAISNYRPKPRVDNGDGTVTTSFEWDGEGSIKMSTYLVAFIVSDFDYITNGAVLPAVEQRVYARPSYIADGRAQLGLEQGEVILTKIGEVLETPYTLNKMDQAGIPDFSAGAMENWGLVTYREYYVLWKEELHTYVDMFNVITIIAHEFGHQWFGNIISPEWWTYIWLNEGFATYFESYGAHLAYPSWRVMDIMVINDLQYSMNFDALSSTRPMSHYAETPSGISGLFDNIAYAKSGSVIRMMEHMMGSQLFFQGLKDYLADRYQNYANEDHLYNIMDEVAKRTGSVFPSEYSLKEVMQSWSNQAGFPVVTMQRNYGNNTATLYQERFFLTAPEQQDGTTWFIPYNFATASDAADPSTAPEGFIPRGTREYLLAPNEAWTEDSWVIMNNYQTGYYRVNYDEKNWELLIEELVNGDDKKINVINKAHLIDDAFNLARAELMKYDVPFKLIKYLSKERDYIPWLAATNGLSYINQRYMGSSHYNRFKSYILSLVEPLLTELGMEDKSDEPFLDKYARTLAIRYACQMGSESCESKATELVTTAVSGETPTKIHPNLYSSVYCAAVRTSSDETFSKIWDLYKSAVEYTEQQHLISALGCSRNSNQIEELLQNSLSESAANRNSLIAAVYTGSEIGLESTIHFLHNNDTSRGLESQLMTILNNISQRVSQNLLADVFNQLLSDLQNFGVITESNVNSLKQNVETTNTWYTKNHEVIDSWLEANVDDEDDDPGRSSSIYVSTVALFVSVLVILFR